MAIFIPALLEGDKAELNRQIVQLANYVDRMQIDFADQSLVQNLTVLPDQLDPLPSRCRFDAHLMVTKPMPYFASLKRAGFETVIIHAEAEGKLTEMVPVARGEGLKLALAINPETSLESIHELLLHSSLDFIQLMGVHPGFGNQVFIDAVYQKIVAAKRFYPTMELAVDGGVRPTNVSALLEAGADLLVVGKHGYNAGGDLQSGITHWHNLLET